MLLRSYIEDPRFAVTTVENRPSHSNFDFFRFSSHQSRLSVMGCLSRNFPRVVVPPQPKRPKLTLQLRQPQLHGIIRRPRISRTSETGKGPSTTSNRSLLAVQH